MPEGRCDLVLLGWTAFVGFNLLSDFLWNGSRHQAAGSTKAADTAAALGSSAPASPEIFRGQYRLLAHGSVIEQGNLRLALASQQTSIAAVRVSSLAMTFSRSGGSPGLRAFRAREMHFSGMEFGGVGEVTATGTSEPGRLASAGSRKCRFDISLRLGGGLGTSRGPLPLQKGDTAGKGAVAQNGPRTDSLVGWLVTADCGFTGEFAAEAVNMIHMSQKVVHYSIMANALAIVQMRFYLLQMRYTEEGPSAAKVSVICIAMQALMDAYDSFLHLCLGLSTQFMFNAIAVVALFKFIMFALLEARYMLTIWRQRRREAFDEGWDAVRRELSWLYSRFYGVLIIGLILIYHSLDHLSIIVLCFQLYWVPQILTDAYQGSRSAIAPAFVVGISASRTLFVLYLWGCPENVFAGDAYPQLPGSPSTSFCILAASLQGAQVAIMLLQQRLGPRWFVPWRCMPWAYNYHGGTRAEPGTECVICMVEIEPEAARHVTAPCSHRFHRHCLEQWMDVKMECPTCRAALPPIQ